MLLATNTRVGVDSPSKTLLGLSLLVTGRDWDWVELGGRLILVTHWYLLCKVTHYYSGTNDCSLSQTRSVLDWTG